MGSDEIKRWIKDENGLKPIPSDLLINIDSADWAGYEIQKNGTDGSGIINFKT